MIHVGAIGFTSASLIALILLALLLVGGRSRGPGIPIIVAVGLSALWSGANAWQLWAGVAASLPITLVEFCHDAAWLTALCAIGRRQLPRWLISASRLLWVTLVCATISCLFNARIANAFMEKSQLLIGGGLACALLVLILLEQLYRNADAYGRHGLKMLAIGIGGLFAYELFFYSHAVLTGGLSQDLWMARGWVSVVTTPLIAVAARRNPEWALGVFVSRQVVVFSTAVLAIGSYALAMALAGYYLRLADDDWRSAANTAFIMGGLVLLAIVAASGAARRRLKVFVAKHFYRNKYDYRVEWLRFTRTLASSASEDVRVVALRAIADIFESPGAIMLVRDQAGRELQPATAWPIPLSTLSALEPIPTRQELVRFIENRQWVIDLAEYRRNSESYQNIALPEWLQQLPAVRLIFPLLQRQSLVGLVLLYDPPAPFELTFEDRDLLKTLGHHVATLVAQHESDRHLAETRQFEAYHRLTAFMMHDLKNSAAQLQLIVANADRHRQKPEFIDDVVSTVANTGQRLGRLIEQLSAPGSHDQPQLCNLNELLERVIAICAARQPVPILEPVIPAFIKVRAHPERLGNAFEHVLRNAQEASDPADSIVVTLTASAEIARIQVKDSGSGMSGEFVRDRLFKPFDSTKGSKGMGVGAYQVREYVHSLGGDVEVQSTPSAGTSFVITLPIEPGSR